MKGDFKFEISDNGEGYDACLAAATARFGVRRDLAEILLAEVGDGLLVEIGVVGVEGFAESGID